MGWFKRKPELKVGDMVWDSYFSSIGEERKKSEVIRIERQGVFNSEEYYLKTYDGYESMYPRRRKHLELMPEAMPKAIDLRNQEPETFKVYARKEYLTGFGNIPKDATASATKKNNGGYVVYYNGIQCHMPASHFHDSFEDGGQRGMRMRIETKVHAEKGLARRQAMRNTKEEEKVMGGELFGYPPEEDTKVLTFEERQKRGMIAMESESERVREATMKWQSERKDAKIAELEEALKEKEQKYEVARREKVAEEYGIVAERHLWSVTLSTPTKLVGIKIRHGGEHKSEVLTEGRNMVEAAMAAEAMAKGIAEDAHVLSIDYVRVIGALK